MSNEEWTEKLAPLWLEISCSTPDQREFDRLAEFCLEFDEPETLHALHAAARWETIEKANLLPQSVQAGAAKCLDVIIQEQIADEAAINQAFLEVAADPKRAALIRPLLKAGANPFQLVVPYRKDGGFDGNYDMALKRALLVGNIGFLQSLDEDSPRWQDHRMKEIKECLEIARVSHDPLFLPEAGLQAPVPRGLV